MLWRTRAARTISFVACAKVLRRRLAIFDQTGTVGSKEPDLVDQSGWLWRPAKTTISSGSTACSPRPNAHHQQPIVVFEPIHLVEEKRPVIVRNERIEIFKDDETWRLLTSSLEHLLDTCDRIPLAYLRASSRRRRGPPYSSPCQATTTRPR